MADDKKISELTTLSPVDDSDYLVVVDRSDTTMSVDGTTKKALKIELKGDTGDNATVDVGTTTTGNAGTNANVVNVGTTSDAIFNFTIPRGDTGADGACVESVAFVGNDMVFTLEDATTITLTNAKLDLKGDTGATGAKITSAAFVGNDLVFTLDDSSTVTLTNAKIDLKGATGATGATGSTGATGNGISNIALISTVGKVKTYRITYTDATTFDYTVTDGTDGLGTVTSIVAGNNIDVDVTDPANPIVSVETLTLADISDVTASATELNYVDGVTSAIQTQFGNKVTSNVAITSATKTKITYDAKGLVTSGADATTADIADSTNKRYVTDAQLTVIGNTSGTNTGDNATNSQYSGLAASKADLASPTFTGTPTLPTGTTATTQSANDNSTKIATTAYADLHLEKTGGTLSGKLTTAGHDEVGKTYTPASGSQTVALDCALNNIHVVSGNASGTAITFTVANATNSQPFIVSILQGGTTVSTIAGWFSTVRWAGGTAPTLTATLNKRDTFGFIRTGASTYDGFIIGQNC